MNVTKVKIKKANTKTNFAFQTFLSKSCEKLETNIIQNGAGRLSERDETVF